MYCLRNISVDIAYETSTLKLVEIEIDDCSVLEDKDDCKSNETHIVNN